MTRSEALARIFFEFSYILEMQQVPYKPRAYALAAEAVRALGDEVEHAWRTGGIQALEELPSIGTSIAGKIDEFLRTGRIKEYEALKRKFPVDVWGLAQIEGVGPRHIADLYKHLGVKNVRDLRAAVAAHRIRNMPRWGEKSEQKLAKGLSLHERTSGRLLISEALPVAEAIIARLAAIPGVTQCTYAGSLRRMQETVGDIDLLVTSEDPQRVMDAFVNLPQVVAIHEHGDTRSSVRLALGIDADLRVVSAESYGAALQYFTGDKKHNILLREHAIAKGYRLNEYGLIRGARRIRCFHEDDVYRALGMETPPPEIRIGDRELELAEQKRLPTLLPYDSLKGDLQVQTTWTDGAGSIEVMIKTAIARGLEYIAITDHTKALAFIHGLDDERVLEQGREITRLNAKHKTFTIFKGTECDILRDGSLDLKNATLATLDWVGVSIHSHFDLSRREQTTRILRAIANPHVHCLFHPTCRIIGKREPIDFDMEEVLAAAKAHNVALEIDAHPERMDLRDIHIRAAIRAGVMLVINSDAHLPEDFDYLRLGIGTARRGWAEEKHILNTKSARHLKTFLTKKR